MSLLENVEPVRSNPLLLLSDFAFVLSSFLIFFICSVYCHSHTTPRTIFQAIFNIESSFFFLSHQLYVSKKLIIYIKKANKIFTEK